MRTRHSRARLAFIPSFTLIACGGTPTESGSEPDRADYVERTGDALSTGVVAQADSYVRDGSSASGNFGTATTILVKNSGSTNSGFNRWIYLKFDLSAVSGTV